MQLYVLESAYLVEKAFSVAWRETHRMIGRDGEHVAQQDIAVSLFDGVLGGGDDGETIVAVLSAQNRYTHAIFLKIILHAQGEGILAKGEIPVSIPPRICEGACGFLSPSSRQAFGTPFSSVPGGSGGSRPAQSRARDRATGRGDGNRR